MSLNSLHWFLTVVTVKSFPSLELSTMCTPNILCEVKECSTGEAELQVTAGLVIPNWISRNRREGGILF